MLMATKKQGGWPALCERGDGKRNLRKVFANCYLSVYEIVMVVFGAVMLLIAVVKLQMYIADMFSKRK